MPSIVRLVVAVVVAVLVCMHTQHLRTAHADTFRIGRRVAGDRVVLKKVLLSVPSAVPTNHTVIYEFAATSRAVSCIEYHIENLADEANRVSADIAFTGDASLAAHFELVNITELVIVMSIYGFDQFAVPLDFRPILRPQFLLSGAADAEGGTPQFGLGFRRRGDELVHFYPQETTRTDGRRNHSLVFETVVRDYITYVSFAVDVSVQFLYDIILSENINRSWSYK